MSLAVGEIVGDYRITGVIGGGGSGEVYRVEHTITRRVEALKALASGRHHPIDEEQRFLREIQVQASLQHPNIASVHNAFFTRDGLALIMELVEGEALDAILERGRIPLAAAVAYALQVLAALRYAHAHGVLHRDVKPGNIIVTRNGVVKLTDFGLARAARSARLTQSGELAGSPYYMSPEQIGDSPLDARTDLYSLGVVLYEMACGQRPFTGESSFAVMQAHVERKPVPPVEVDPTIGPALDCAILTALAKDPADRFQSAEKFEQALVAARETLHLPRSAVGRRRWTRLPGVPVSRTVRTAALIAVGVGALIAAAMVSTGRHQSPERPDRPPVAVEPRAAPALAVPPAAEPQLAAPAAPLEAVADAAPAPEPAPRPAARKRAPRPRDVVILGAATYKPEAPPAVEGGAPLNPPVVDSAPAPGPPETAVVSAGPAATVTTAPAQKKRGNRMLRTLGKIVRPWKAGDKRPEDSAAK